MKRMPTSLITFLEVHPNCHKADCFVISLPTGGVLCATEGQWDITIRANTPGWSGPQTTFKAVEHGVWSRGAITSEATTKCSANAMDLTCVAQADTVYPGLDMPLLAAALNRLFDAATVWVYTVYMPIGGYGDVSAGVETKFQGTITKIPALTRNMVRFECADPMYLLNLKVPSRLIQSNCTWSFCDVNCTLSAGDYTLDFTVQPGSTQNRLTGPLTQPDGYYEQGVVTCITGANAGLSQTVKSYTGGVLTLTYPFLLPVAAGDTFAVIKGCAKTPTACADTARPDGTLEPQDFRVRYGGEPLVPAPTAAF